MFAAFLLIHTTSQGTIFFLTTLCTVPNLVLLGRWIAKLYIEEKAEL